MVAGLEGLLRLTANRIEEPLEWYHLLAQGLAEDLERLQDAGVTSDVVFVGTSMVWADVSVATIEEQLTSVVWAHNAGLPAGMTPVVRRWLLEEVEPRIHPQRVVWGVSSLDFNANRFEPSIDAYNQARATRPGWLGAIDRFLSDHLMLARHRAQLRDPQTIGDLLFGSPFPPGEELPLEDLMSPVNDSEPEGRQTQQGLLRRRVLRDYAVGETELEDFRFTVRTLQDMGIEVVVVLMPVPQSYVSYHPNGEDDFRLFRETMIGEVAELGVPLLDYSRVLPDEEFIDSTHLDESGSVVFSQMLAADLADLGW